jgi:predicted Kef-type K+ transport protein
VVAPGKGWKAWTAVLPLTVIAKALVELSMNLLDWQVSREVFVIAVRGAALGVKAEV